MENHYLKLKKINPTCFSKDRGAFSHSEIESFLIGGAMYIFFIVLAKPKAISCNLIVQEAKKKSLSIVKWSVQRNKKISNE